MAKKYSFIDRVNYYSVKWGKVKSKEQKAFCAGYVDFYHGTDALSGFKTNREKTAYLKGRAKCLAAENKARTLKW